jgi:hypothetical protein
MHRNSRGEVANLRRANRLRDILAAKQYALHLAVGNESDIQSLGKRGELRGIVGINPRALSSQRKRAVHRTCIEEYEPQRARQTAC